MTSTIDDQTESVCREPRRCSAGTDNFLTDMMEKMETDLQIVGRQMMLLPRKNATVLKYMCECPRNQRHLDSTSSRSTRPRHIYAYLRPASEQGGDNYPYFMAPPDEDGNNSQPVFVLSSASSTDSNPDLKLIHLDMHGGLECAPENGEVTLALCGASHEGIAEELQRLQLNSEMCCPVIVCEHVDDIGEMSDVQAEMDFRQSQARIGAFTRLSVPSVDIVDERRRPPLPGSDGLIKTWWGV